MSNLIPQAPAGELILFQSADGSTRVECRFASDTLWLSQAEICTLYGKAKATISEHISHLFSEGECDEGAVVRLYRTTAADSKPYNVKHYSLPLILAVGYRVRSPKVHSLGSGQPQHLRAISLKVLPWTMSA